MSTPPDGLHPGVSLAEYTRWNARRSSVLRYGMRSAAHMLWAESRGEQDSTAATELGDVTHCAVLEPERLESRFVLPMRRPRRSNADKQAHAVFELEQAAEGRTVITESQYTDALRIRDRLAAQPWFGSLLSGPGIVELSALWTDPTSGLRCKSRPDRVALRYVGPGWSEPGPVCLDLKTSRDASPAAWQRSVERFGYHLQARMQLEGLAAHDAQTWLDAGTLEPRAEQYLWIVLESVPPHGCALYHPTHELLQLAGLRLRQALALWSLSERSGAFAGYAPEPQPVEPTVRERRAVGPVDDAPLF